MLPPLPRLARHLAMMPLLFPSYAHPQIMRIEGHDALIRRFNLLPRATREVGDGRLALTFE